MRRLIPFVLVLGVVLGALPGTVGVAAAGGKGEFLANCPFSHRATVDPLVHPGLPGMSHRHDFFGNTTTDAFSTLATLQGGTTTCTPVADRSAYWVPTLTVGGRAVAPNRVTVYYSAENADPASIRPYPLGLAMIAGNARATGPSAPRPYDWSCQATVGNQATIPRCPAGSELEMLIHFPDCWNGRDLDSADHHSHVAFSMNHRCPVGYPVAIPRLELKLHYPTRGGPTAVLSSGSGFTTHADFVNAWRPAALARRVTTCLRALVKCDAAGQVIG